MAVNYQTDAPPILYDFLGYLTVEKGYSNLTIYNYFLDIRLFFRYTTCLKTGKSIDKYEEVDIKTIDVQFIESIVRREITSFLTWMALTRHGNENTRNRKIACLKSFFSYLVEMEYIDNNVMSRVSAVKAEKTLPKYLDENAMSELLESINDIFWVRDTAIIMLMMVCGLRVSEVASLNIDSVGDGVISVYGKGKKERQVYLTSQTEEAIKEYLNFRPQVNENALFLSQTKKRLSKRGIQFMTTKYLEKADLQGYSCHKLRHTAATQLLKSGANLRVIQETLGHENISVTELYTHIESEDMKNAMKNLEEAQKSHHRLKEVMT